jgi:uncharacterized protein (DUF1800 family)
MPGWLAACGLPQPAAARLAQPETWAADPTSAVALPGLAADLGAATHLLNRITFGPRPGQAAQVAAIGLDAYLEQQLNPQQIDDSALEQRLQAFQTLGLDPSELLVQFAPRQGAAGGKFQSGPPRVVAELETASLLRAVASERQLLEVMVDFWSNHLNVYIGKTLARLFKTVDDREVIRPHALGTFRDLLLASARSPAMLVYLDNAENTRPGARLGRGGLNENYARELLELHTVGVDAGYSQDDIIAVARTHTGWTIRRPRGADAPGTFVFEPRLHDDGQKTIAFLGLTLPAGGDMREGEMLLARLAEHPKTAERLARKLVTAFVGDTPPEELVSQAAKAYLDSGTDIRATLRAILASAAFHASAGQKIKLPLRMLVSAVRALDVRMADQGQLGLLALVKQLRALGQPFFGWPAPNGYPQAGAAWINSSGMLARWNTALLLAAGQVRGVRPALEALGPAGAQSAEAIVDALGSALLAPGALGADARQALIECVQAGLALPELAGLILASPAFQLH